MRNREILGFFSGNWPLIESEKSLGQMILYILFSHASLAASWFIKQLRVEASSTTSQKLEE